MDYSEIYNNGADDYDRLVSREDAAGRLAPAIQKLVPLAGVRVAEVGCGTGRLTSLLLEAGATVDAVEPAADMRRVCRARLEAQGFEQERWSVSAGEGARLPWAEGWAELAIAGWVYGHQCSWNPKTWRASIGDCIDELERVLRPGGVAVVLETLGTGSETPAAPNQALADYYGWLEETRGFTRTAIRTDYLFESVEEAVHLCGFFFGEEMADAVKTRWGRSLPECTGLWSRRKE